MIAIVLNKVVVEIGLKFIAPDFLNILTLS